MVTRADVERAQRYVAKLEKVAGTSDALSRDVETLSYKDFNKKYGTNFASDVTFRAKLRQTYNFLKQSPRTSEQQKGKALQSSYARIARKPVKPPKKLKKLPQPPKKLKKPPPKKLKKPPPKKLKKPPPKKLKKLPQPPRKLKKPPPKKLKKPPPKKLKKLPQPPKNLKKPPQPPRKLKKPPPKKLKKKKRVIGDHFPTTLAWASVLKYFTPWAFLTSPEKIENVPSDRGYVGVYVHEEDYAQAVLARLEMVAAEVGWDPYFPLLDELLRYFEQGSFLRPDFEKSFELSVAFDVCFYVVDPAGTRLPDKTRSIKFYPNWHLLRDFLEKLVGHEGSKEYPGEVIIRYIKPITPILSPLLVQKEWGQRKGIYISFRYASRGERQQLEREHAEKVEEREMQKAVKENWEEEERRRWKEFDKEYEEFREEQEDIERAIRDTREEIKLLEEQKKYNEARKLEQNVKKAEKYLRKQDEYVDALWRWAIHPDAPHPDEKEEKK